MKSWLAPLLSVSLVSLISLIGIFSLSLNKKLLQKLIFFLVAFAAGGMLGDTFFHLMPQISQKFTSPLLPSVSILIGFLLFFILEKFLKWRHCHDINCQEHRQALGRMSLVADGFHNFIDGAVIAASFLVNFRLGIATTLAIVLHEIPQEIGDFAVLIYSGFSRQKALFFNFLSALTAVLGAVVVLLLGNITNQLANYLIPLAAGGFIYVSASGLIPQLHKEVALEKSARQFLGLILGMSIMGLLLLIE